MTIFSDGRASAKPQVLFVTGHLPYPPISGGRVRELELISRLADRFGFHLLVSTKTFEEDRANVEAVRPLCESIQIWQAGRDPLPGDPAAPELLRSIWAPGVAEAAAELVHAGEIDVVHVERFHLMCHLPSPVEVPVVLVEQNIEYSLWHQRMHIARTGRTRRRFLLEYAATVRAEIDAWRRADLLGAVTEEDRDIIRWAVPEKDVRLIPHGSNVSTGPVDEGGEPQKDTLLFAANFAYRPNADAALYLCHEIFPKIRAAVPTARLILVGNDPPADIRALEGDGIEVTGRVPSLLPYLSSAQVVICPLREGGGMKAKIVEALALGKAVVTTTIGAQGFGSAAEEAMRIEDRPAALARAAIDLLRDEVSRRNLELGARRLAESLPTWDDAAEALAACYRDLLPAKDERVATFPGA